jgi:putative membrane protein
MGRDVDDGVEPDPRFSLANERTLLAWIRTSIALIAGALAASQLLERDITGARWVLAVPLAVLGIVVAGTSHGRYAAIQRAMRRGEPLPSSPLPWILAAGVTFIGAAALVLIVIDAL